MVWLYICLALVCEHFVGSLSFARIFTWHFAHKDITKEGSNNPGTMNILRTRGMGEALLTLFFDALKVGGIALALYFVFREYFPGYENVAYYLVSFVGIFAHCFPIYYKFKGGKGVASTFGMFVFSPQFWWLSLIMFAFCFVLFMFVHYGFVINFLFILVMSVYSTCLFAINKPFLFFEPSPQNLFFVPIIVIWAVALLVVFCHRQNIVRLFNGTENKVNFREKVFGKLLKKNKTKEESNDKTTTV